MPLIFVKVFFLLFSFISIYIVQFYLSILMLYFSNYFNLKIINKYYIFKNLKFGELERHFAIFLNACLSAIAIILLNVDIFCYQFI